MVIPTLVRQKTNATIPTLTNGATVSHRSHNSSSNDPPACEKCIGGQVFPTLVMIYGKARLIEQCIQCGAEPTPKNKRKR